MPLSPDGQAGAPRASADYISQPNTPSGSDTTPESSLFRGSSNTSNTSQDQDPLDQAPGGAKSSLSGLALSVSTQGPDSGSGQSSPTSVLLSEPAGKLSGGGEAGWGAQKGPGSAALSSGGWDPDVQGIPTVKEAIEALNAQESLVGT